MRLSGLTGRYWLAAPYLLIAWPVLVFAAQNAKQGILSFTVVATPIFLVSIGLTVVATALFVAARDFPRSILVAMLITFVPLFLYPTIWDVGENASFLGVRVTRHMLLLPATTLVMAAAIFLVLRTRWDARPLLRWIAYGMTVLVALNLIRIAVDRPPRAPPPNETHLSEEFKAVAADLAGIGARSPDIYVMLFDGYGSSEVLSRYYGFDNHEFLDHIRDLGFTVHTDARSNYIGTDDSLASIWNMNYIDADTSVSSVRVLSGLLAPNGTVAHTAAGKLFAEAGYKTLADNTNHSRIDNTDYSLKTKVRRVLFSRFSRALVDQYALRWVINDEIARQWIIGPSNGQFNLPESILRTLDIPADPAPTLAFIYSTAPHPPNYFNRDGTVKPIRDAYIAGSNDWRDADAYLDQVHVVNQVIGNTVEEILNRSDRPPVIVLLADHGPASQTDGVLWNIAIHDPSNRLVDERTGILNAMFLPEQCTDQPHPGLTSVNLFRFILSSCLGADIELLPDETYWGRGVPYLLVHPGSEFGE